MSLFGHTRDAFRWVGSVLGVFFRVRPWTTLALIIFATISRFASLLAFFLPLKVILLAGSDGVPRYFTFFIDPADKMPWIIGLSLAAVGFYILSLILDAAAKRLAEAGSSEVLEGANEIAVASKQRAEAQGYYASFSGIASSGLLVVLSFGVLALINGLLFSVLMGLCILQYLFTALVLKLENPLKPGPTQRFIHNNLSGYLSIFSSINFLTCFFVILIPIVLGGGGNLLLAILSILLLRRSIGDLSSIVTTTAALTEKRVQIDPMIFRHRQMQKREKPVIRNLRQAFNKKERERTARHYLELGGLEASDLFSEWKDSGIRGAYTFRIRLNKETDQPRYLQQQVFTTGSLQALEHEEYLFQKVSRDLLHAPRVLARYTQGPFESQICEFGLGKSFGSKEWTRKSRDLMAHFWSVAPPRELISAFNTSRPTLEGRLTADYLQRLEVALDHPAEMQAYDDLLERLPAIQKILSGIPVYIYNPDLSRSGVADFGGGDCRVMTWGRWAIEPIGAALLNPITPAVISEILEQVRERRSLKAEQLTVDHVHLAFDCRELELEVMKGVYEKAIKRIRHILNNDLVKAVQA